MTDLLTALLNAAEWPAGAELPSGSQLLERSKTVHKPWGEERWLVPEGAPFGFKMIVVRAGLRTSLQYHRHKEEANLVLSGTGRLHMAASAAEPMRIHPLVPGQIAHVLAGVVHRVEAVTDLLIVEVSTPELDDVVRLADDSGRGDGRIAAEHKPQRARDEA
jgi:mannose-6-phosphate isomerase-like protein (cupin superfamily)